MPPTPHPQRRQRISANSLFALNVGLVALLIAMVGGVIWFERDQAVQQAARNARNLADVLAAQTRENFQAIDQSLLAIIERLQADNIADDSQIEPTYQLLYDSFRTAPNGVMFYFVLGPDGRTLNSSLTPDRDLTDPSDREGFIVQRDDYKLGFNIGRTVRGRLPPMAGRWIFTVSRRFVKSDGSFGGIVAATIAVDRLAVLYDALNVGEDGLVTLFHRDGYVLARSPADERAVGQDLSSGPLFRNGLSRSDAGWMISTSPADHTTRVLGFHALQEFPLAVVVGLSQERELTAWKRYATIGGGATLAVAALILLLLTVMQRRIRQSLRDEDRYVEAELRRKDELEGYSRQLLKAQELANMGNWRLELGAKEMQVSPMLQRIAGRAETGVDPVEEAANVIHPEDKPRLMAMQEVALKSGEPQQIEYRIVRPDGAIRHLWSEVRSERGETGAPIALFGIVQDITERKTTEEQLRQSQKMETIGHLTGGVAHDFNNLLMVIMGNLDLLLERMQDDADTAAIVNSAITATERGASLTRQLLAYARRQPLAPRELDVNAAIQGLSRLLRRTLGEQVEIETILGGGLWHAMADATQVENAVINLAINARDAMPNGGKLTLETANAAFDEDYIGLNDEVAPGQYVMIAVTDTGTGMPADVAARAFEPFFTTKPVGRGTGLGLSMVYGFAKQSGGHAKIYTEPGHGTTVKLYLPRARVAADAAPPAPAAAPDRAAGETILVVEDDELVRGTVERMLKELGFKTILAATAEEALPILESGRPFDLLFTDVVLPGKMGGRELSERAHALRPGLPVIFSSGYTQNSIIHQGRLDADIELLSKPYKKQDLARRLRAVLDRAKR
ncbi:MAG: ATP-binding protein [Alphaproteobacteria bacterium]